MKKILLFLILLVNLQANIENHSLTLTVGKAAAQDMMYEMLGGSDPYNSLICDLCGRSGWTIYAHERSPRKVLRSSEPNMHLLPSANQNKRGAPMCIF